MTRAVFQLPFIPFETRTPPGAARANFAFLTLKNVAE